MADYCPNCGAMARPGATFCNTCGRPISPAGTARPGPALPAPAWPTPTVARPWAAAGAPPATLWAEDGRQFPLTAPVTRIGREPGSDVAVADHQASSRHAEVSIQGAGYVLCDVGSRNGTYVNGQRLVGDCRLSDGDTILVGATRFTFRLGAAAGGAAPGPSQTVGMDPAAVQALLSAPGQMIVPAPWPGVAASVGSIVPASTPPQGVPVQAPAGFWAALTGPRAAGRVQYDPKEAQEPPPFDLSRALVVLAVVLAFIGAIATFVATVLAAAIVLVCLGAGALLFIVPFLFMPLQMMFNGILGRLRDQKPITMLRFRIDDELSGRPVDVTLARKMSQGGGFYQDDRVQVWGRLKSGALQASRVRVEGSGATVRAHRPWPLWIGLLAIGSAIGGLLYLAQSLGVVSF